MPPTGTRKPVAPEVVPTPDTFIRQSGRTITWDNFLRNMENLTRVPPVTIFKHAPLGKIWEMFAKPGLVVELRNPFIREPVDAYWVGTIVYYAGYYALVKFENFSLEPAQIAWITFVSDVPKHIGWCKENGKLLYPGADIANQVPDYMERIAHFVANKETISEKHWEVVQSEIDSMSLFSAKLPVEVRNVSEHTENRLAKITASFGDQYTVQYLDLTFEDATGHIISSNPTFQRIYPLGYSASVGLKLKGVPDKFPFPTIPSSKFPDYPKDIQNQIRVGMRFETRHPDMAHKIVGAQVVTVLRRGYFIAETCEVKEDERVKFYTHITSPLLFPSGWGHHWQVDVEDYRRADTSREFLPLHLLPQRVPHEFHLGMVVEARDTTERAFFGAATIRKIADHMLFIHFNNWDEKVEKNSAWIDVDQGDIYPIGYTDLFCIEFQGHV